MRREKKRKGAKGRRREGGTNRGRGGDTGDVVVQREVTKEVRRKPSDFLGGHSLLLL